MRIFWATIVFLLKIVLQPRLLNTVGWQRCITLISALGSRAILGVFSKDSIEQQLNNKYSREKSANDGMLYDRDCEI